MRLLLLLLLQLLILLLGVGCRSWRHLRSGSLAALHVVAGDPSFLHLPLRLAFGLLLVDLAASYVVKPTLLRRLEPGAPARLL